MKVKFTKQARQITAAVNREIGRAALGFQANITKAWPVDTGESRNAWRAPVEVEPGTWVVSNDVLYSAVLWRGRHVVGGKAYGSEQMPQGGYPTLAKTVSRLTKNLKDL